MFFDGTVHPVSIEMSNCSEKCPSHYCIIVNPVTSLFRDAQTNAQAMAKAEVQAQMNGQAKAEKEAGVRARGNLNDE